MKIEKLQSVTSFYEIDFQLIILFIWIELKTLGIASSFSFFHIAIKWVNDKTAKTFGWGNAIYGNVACDCGRANWHLWPYNHSHKALINIHKPFLLFKHPSQKIFFFLFWYRARIKLKRTKTATNLTSFTKIPMDKKKLNFYLLKFEVLFQLIS